MALATNLVCLYLASSGFDQNWNFANSRNPLLCAYHFAVNGKASSWGNKFCKEKDHLFNSLTEVHPGVSKMFVYWIFVNMVAVHLEHVGIQGGCPPNYSAGPQVSQASGARSSRGRVLRLTGLLQTYYPSVEFWTLFLKFVGRLKRCWTYWDKAPPASLESVSIFLTLVGQERVVFRYVFVGAFLWQAVVLAAPLTGCRMRRKWKRMRKRRMKRRRREV